MTKRITKLGWALIICAAALAIGLFVSRITKAADSDNFSISSNGKLTKYNVPADGAPSTITVPDNVTSIGQNAFSDVRDQSNDVQVILGSNVTSIDAGAFSGASSITGVQVNGRITAINDSTFANSGLASFTIPSSVTSIGSQAFAETAISSINIPQAVSSIQSDAFSGDSSLSAITVDSSNSTYTSDNGALYTKSGTLLIVPPALSSITAKSDTKAIASNAFEGSNITSFTVPASVTSISENAFADSSISDLTILSDNVSLPQTLGLATGSTIKCHSGSTASNYNTDNYKIVIIGSGSSDNPDNPDTPDNPDNPDKPAVTTHAVKFDANGGTLSGSDSLSVEDGKTIAEGQVPTASRDGYLFAGWKSSVKSIASVDDPITSDVIFTAQWSQVSPNGSYKVVFDVNGGSPDYQPEIVPQGGKAVNPGSPSRDGWTFLGWYYGDDAWNFDNPVNSNITLTAWYKSTSGAISQGKGIGTGGGNGNGATGSTHTKDQTPKTAGPVDARYFLALAMLLAGISVLLYARHVKMEYVVKNKKNDR